MFKYKNQYYEQSLVLKNNPKSEISMEDFIRSYYKNGYHDGQPRLRQLLPNGEWSDNTYQLSTLAKTFLLYEARVHIFDTKQILVETRNSYDGYITGVKYFYYESLDDFICTIMNWTNDFTEFYKNV
jgi:hypothetical protein